MKLDLFDYQFPQNQVAYYPCESRDKCRLLVFNRAINQIKEHIFNEIIDYFQEGDVLVYNNSKVLKARLKGNKLTGGKLEILLLNEYTKKELWECLIRGGSNLKENDRIKVNSQEIKIIEKNSQGKFIIEFINNENILDFVEKNGEIPLPPYIKRSYEPKIDDEAYQTIFAGRLGSVASPTAGLHLSHNLVEALNKKKVELVPITLHVNWGTFKEIKCEDITLHKMHKEKFEIKNNACQIINNARARGNKIFATGTTSLRALESACNSNGELIPCKEETDLYIYPGYKFKIVDGLVTNFHRPKSTLLLLVSAFAGIENVRHIYHYAISNNFKLFSYGDAMLIT
jgi:S-adenosylmethionine:tRNA ribosyltransferase-isomerase